MEYENISLGEAIDILEEVMELDDSIYAYNRKYRMALEFVIDCIKRDMAESEDFPQAKDIEPTVKNFSKVLNNKLISNAIEEEDRCCFCGGVKRFGICQDCGSDM